MNAHQRRVARRAQKRRWFELLLYSTVRRTWFLPETEEEVARWEAEHAHEPPIELPERLRDPMAALRPRPPAAPGATGEVGR